MNQITSKTSKFFMFSKPALVDAQIFMIISLLVKKDFKIKYRDSLLGFAWSMINPLLFMLIVGFVFSGVFKSVENYSIFVLSGILLWNMGNLSIMLGTSSIVNSSFLLRKIKIPIWIFPLVPVGICLINFLLALIPFVAICYFFQVALGLKIFLLPILLFFYAAFCAGISLALASINVFFRDVAHVLEPLLTLTFYATPVIYDRAQINIPYPINNLQLLNPFLHFVEVGRGILIGTKQINMLSVYCCIIFAVVSCVCGFLVFRKTASKILLNI